MGHISMAIQQAQWLVEKRVIFGYAYGELTNDEMAVHNERMIALLDSAEPFVHALLVTHPETQLPTPSLTSGRNILSFIGHPNLGWNVIVHNPHSIMSKLSVVLAKIARARYRQFANIDMALSFLKEIDKTVDWDSADMRLLNVIDSQPPSASNST